MALTLLLKVDSILADCTQATIIDNTDEFDPVSNKGGYAPPGSVPAAITVFADSTVNPGVKTKVTSTAHGLIENQVIIIVGTTNYNGTFTITNVVTNTYDILKVFVGDDATGTWIIENPLRSAFAAFFFVDKIDVLGVVDTTLTTDNSAPATTQSWNITLVVDGYHKMYMSLIPNYDATITYAVGEVVFENLSTWRSLIGSNLGNTPSSSPSEWVQDITRATITAASNGTHVIHNELFTCRSEVGFTKSLLKSVEDACEDCSGKDDIQEHETIAILLDGIILHDFLGNSIKAEKITVKLTEVLTRLKLAI